MKKTLNQLSINLTKLAENPQNQEILQSLSKLLEVYNTTPQLQPVILESLKMLNTSIKTIANTSIKPKEETYTLTDENPIYFKEEKEKKYIHNWSAFVYGKNYLDTKFASYQTTLNNDSPNFALRIKPYKNNQYVFQYVPNQLFKSINPFSRGIEKQQIISLILTEKELNTISITEKTNFKLENGKDLLEEIISVNKQYDAPTCNMPKILLPYKEQLPIPEQDIILANIICNFFKKGISTSKSHSLYSINVSANNDILNLENFLYLARTFSKTNYKPTIISSQENPSNHIYQKKHCQPYDEVLTNNDEKFQTDYNLKETSNNNILINGYAPSSINQTSKTLMLSITNNAFCTQQNIDAFYNYILNIEQYFYNNPQFTKIKEETLDQLEKINFNLSNSKYKPHR